MALVLVLSGLQQVTPRGPVGPTTQQGTALSLGESAPDAEFDVIIECVGEALGADYAPHADGLGSILRRPLHKEGVWICGAARGLNGPICIE